jgi:hypothetical protein
MPPYSDRTFTFFHQFYCRHCCVVFLVPCTKQESEIPPAHRLMTVEKLRRGAKLLWTMNPEDSELVRLREEVRCPNELSGSDAVRHWPLGGGT